MTDLRLVSSHNDPKPVLFNEDDGQPGFGVYVHWPFCAAKCPYCDFNSHVRHGGVDQARYARALATEVNHMAAMQPGQKVTSVFFGGGTPSLMEPDTVAHVLQAIDTAWGLDEGIEITLEANPTSVEADRFRAYRAAGVNRVSLGVQSLDDAQLKFLGRLHSAREAMDAIETARAIFPRFSFDLIYARPDQTLKQWEAELRAALALSGGHLSLYQLTIEQETPFHRLHANGKLQVPDAEHAAQLYELTQDITADAGLPAYEISNHATPGLESRHNLTYWRFGTWAGIGPGAHGRLSMNDGRRATATQRNPELWLKAVETDGHGMVENEVMDDVDAADEMLLMGLRLKEGLRMPRYEALTGHPINAERLSDLIEYGMIEHLNQNRIRATAEGCLVLDAVIADLAS